MRSEISSADLDLDWIAQAILGPGAQRDAVGRTTRIQSLWGGYGEIVRVEFESADVPSVIVKWVRPPPRSRSDARGDARKRRSYDVEAHFYRTLAPQCDDDVCRVAKLIDSRIGGKGTEDERLLILEDLDAAGFDGRRRRANEDEIDACLGWLAGFHARFLGTPPKNLWSIGTYWHLDTRPDELAIIEDVALREAAPRIDRILRTCTYQTIVHGDAKLANFCFSGSGKTRSSSPSVVAAVDFQYVGGGCGMKDVAYLLSGASETAEAQHLDVYFRYLRDACAATGKSVEDVAALEKEWRALYPIACVDFYRFLAGWSKHHYESDVQAKRLTQRVLREL